MGYLANRRKGGLLAHSVLAADLDGVSLGLLHQRVWARDPEELGHRELRKELIRWWLLTTLAVETLADAQRVVLWDSRR